MCQLQATLKGAQFKVAAYKRENEKLADGAEAAKLEITGAFGSTRLMMTVAGLSCSGLTHTEWLAFECWVLNCSTEVLKLSAAS